MVVGNTKMHSIVERATRDVGGPAACFAPAGSRSDKKLRHAETKASSRT
jgi:hypothetical protein